MKFIRKYLKSFIALFYPKVCLTCGVSLQGNENILCAWCMHTLPETGYHCSVNNPVSELFYGRILLNHAFAFLFFDKESRYRHLIYQLKYHGRKEAGIFLGKLIGSRILEADFKTIDAIVPVPLHPSKQRRRGYNQSEVLAEGVSSILKKPVLKDAISRKVITSTQTKKGRFERWLNVEGIFQCDNPERLEGRHILLIDDVVTTGATLEALASPILRLNGTSISIATAAYASTG